MPRGESVGPQWLALVYAFNTLGELCLSPIGLSLVNKLALAQSPTLMMAVWFMCTAFANYLRGSSTNRVEQSNIGISGPRT